MGSSLFGYFKLNAHGVVRGNPGQTRCSSVIRNCFCQWIVSYSWDVGITANFVVKLCGLRDDLVLIL